MQTSASTKKPIKSVIMSGEKHVRGASGDNLWSAQEKDESWAIENCPEVNIVYAPFACGWIHVFFHLACKSYLWRSYNQVQLFYESIDEVVFILATINYLCLLQASNIAAAFMYEQLRVVS